MAELVEVLPDFPGLAVKYDPSKNPFFRPIVVENLRKIQSVEAGKTLLTLIADARARFRADFTAGINVTVIPRETTFVQSGHKKAYVQGGGMTQTLEKSADPRHAPAGCPFYILGGSRNMAKDPASSTNGTGSVCNMEFTNVQIITSKGETTYPFLVLAHELIHSYHCLYGIKKDGKDEELCTTGIGIYADDPLTENVFRTQFKMALRVDYF